MKLLHMITSSPARTPTFTLFGNDNYFFATANGGACAKESDCVSVGSGFAWNHGDFQRQITRAWVGMVGPGIKKLGRNDDTFTDHTDVRPTMLALLGLKDDYVGDGRVVAEWIDDKSMPKGIKKNLPGYLQLAKVYKQLNAPVGELGHASMIFANRSVTSDDKTYARYLKTIGDITNDREQLGSQMRTALSGAAFDNQGVNEFAELGLDIKGQLLIDSVNLLAGPERHNQD
jgi:hypothetical protein